jgi:hypothetical protein
MSEAEQRGAAEIEVPEEPAVRGARRGRLLRLAVSCPRCGSRPALRVTEETVRAVVEAAEEDRLGTYQCHRRGCGTIYDLTAAAYQNAS